MAEDLKTRRQTNLLAAVEACLHNPSVNFLGLSGFRGNALEAAAALVASLKDVSVLVVDKEKRLRHRDVQTVVEEKVVQALFAEGGLGKARSAYMHEPSRSYGERRVRSLLKYYSVEEDKQDRGEILDELALYSKNIKNEQLRELRFRALASMSQADQRAFNDLGEALVGAGRTRIIWIHIENAEEVTAGKLKFEIEFHMIANANARLVIASAAGTFPAELRVPGLVGFSVLVDDETEVDIQRFSPSTFVWREEKLEAQPARTDNAGDLSKAARKDLLDAQGTLARDFVGQLDALNIANSAKRATRAFADQCELGERANIVYLDALAEAMFSELKSERDAMPPAAVKLLEIITTNHVAIRGSTPIFAEYEAVLSRYRNVSNFPETEFLELVERIEAGEFSEVLDESVGKAADAVADLGGNESVPPAKRVITIGAFVRTFWQAIASAPTLIRGLTAIGELRTLVGRLWRWIELHLPGAG